MKEYDIAGPQESGGQTQGMSEALRLLHTARRGKPTPQDAPALSTLPMTAAARVAVRLNRALDKK